MAGQPINPCRGCFAELKDKPAYSFVWQEIRELFMECTAIKIPDEQLTDSPQEICADCYSKCEQWHSFKVMCQEVNDHILRSSGILTTPASQPNSRRSSRSSTYVEEDSELTFGQLMIKEEILSDGEEEEEDENTLQQNDSKENEESLHVQDMSNNNLSIKRTDTEETVQAKEPTKKMDKCPICGSTELPLFKHILDNHRHKDHPLRCVICKRTWNRSQALSLHLLMHTGEIKSRRSSVHQSIAPKEEDSDSPPIKPQKSTKKTPKIEVVDNKKEKKRKTKGDKKRPRTVFDPNAVKVCSVCSRHFLSVEDLLTHSTTHTNEQPFCCKHCDVRCKTKSILSKHLKSEHPNLIGPYPCESMRIDPDSKYAKLWKSKLFKKD